MAYESPRGRLRGMDCVTAFPFSLAGDVAIVRLGLELDLSGDWLTRCIPQLFADLINSMDAPGQLSLYNTGRQPAPQSAAQRGHGRGSTRGLHRSASIVLRFGACLWCLADAVAGPLSSLCVTLRIVSADVYARLRADARATDETRQERETMTHHEAPRWWSRASGHG